jgi:hypothetical protein
VTITKWSRIWEERQPDVALKFVPGPESDQLAVLHDGRADVSFVRHPIELGAVNAIRLYEELPVIIVSSDDPLAEMPTVTLADLAVYTVHETPAMPMPDAIALIAAGVGVVVVPHSVARLHSRKDVVAKQLTDAPQTVISIAWLADALLADALLADALLADGNAESAHGNAESNDRNAASTNGGGRSTHDNLGELIDEFVGIVRGRSANSSRSAAVTHTTPAAEDAPVARKPQQKAQPLSAKAQAKATARAKADTFARRARVQKDRRKQGR